MITVASEATLQNLLIVAHEALLILFHDGVAVVTFTVPLALVTSGLATGWPRDGGVYLWVKDASGPLRGFRAVWMQSIQGMVVATPVSLDLTRRRYDRSGRAAAGPAQD